MCLEEVVKCGDFWIIQSSVRSLQVHQQNKVVINWSRAHNLFNLGAEQLNLQNQREKILEKNPEFT